MLSRNNSVNWIVQEMHFTREGGFTKHTQLNVNLNGLARVSNAAVPFNFSDPVGRLKDHKSLSTDCGRS